MPFLFVLNQATLNANITARAVAALSHHGPVAQNIPFSSGECERFDIAPDYVILKAARQKSVTSPNRRGLNK